MYTYTYIYIYIYIDPGQHAADAVGGPLAVGDPHGVAVGDLLSIILLLLLLLSIILVLARFFAEWISCEFSFSQTYLCCFVVLDFHPAVHTLCLPLTAVIMELGTRSFSHVSEKSDSCSSGRATEQQGHIAAWLQGGDFGVTKNG